MSEGWRISYLQASFVAHIADRVNRTTAALERDPPPKTTEIDRLTALIDRTQDFVDALAALKAAPDPTTLMRAAQDEAGMPVEHYYVLEKGAWRGFYFVDHDNKVAVGMLALCEDDDPVKPLREALKETQPKQEK